MTGEGRKEGWMTLIVGQLVIVNDLLVVAMSLRLAVKDEWHNVPVSGQKPKKFHRTRLKYVKLDILCRVGGNLRTGRKLMGPATATCLTPSSSRCWSQIQVGSSAAYVRPKTTPLMMLPMQWRKPGTRSTPSLLDGDDSFNPFRKSTNIVTNSIIKKLEGLYVPERIPGRDPWHATPSKRRLDVRPSPTVSWRSSQICDARAKPRLQRKSNLNKWKLNYCHLKYLNVSSDSHRGLSWCRGWGRAVPVRWKHPGWKPGELIRDL